MRHQVDERQAQDFLARRFGDVTDLHTLTGGLWSSAYAFSHAGQALVARFGHRKDWFEADRAAMAFSSPDLPVPEVLEVGDAFGGAYAISVRHYGTNLEDVRPDQADVAGPMLASLLGALFRVPKSPDGPVVWDRQQPGGSPGWRDWLRHRLLDDPQREASRWRELLSAENEQLYRSGEARVAELIDSCPERRELVHGDLLHANVLVTGDASRPTAVFSWKCSVRGDFLYDTAWCSFCSIWHPGIAALDVWGLVHGEPSIRDDPDAFVDASLRHHCYEVHIGLTALAGNTWLRDAPAVQLIATHLSELLERGPLPAVL